jgi:hypothetical protein
VAPWAEPVARAPSSEPVSGRMPSPLASSRTRRDASHPPWEALRTSHGDGSAAYSARLRASGGTPTRARVRPAAAAQLPRASRGWSPGWRRRAGRCGRMVARDPHSRRPHQHQRVPGGD